MPNFLEALRTRLKTEVPELSEVYLSSSDVSAVFPYLIINRLWEDEIETSIPGENFKETRLQFSLFSLNDFQAESLGRAVYKVLKPIPSNQRLVFDDGYEMGRHPGRLIGPTDTLDTIVDQKVWRLMFDYTWDIGVNDV